MKTEKRQPKPQWLKADIPSGDKYFKIKKELEKRNLCTICQQARCPNISECWNNHHATFLIMGDTCSRNCGFCSVKHGEPEFLDSAEPQRVVEMASIMDAHYVVLTSVTRDDLPDGGAAHFAAVIKALKNFKPNIRVEVLTPDFKGNTDHMDIVLNAAPDVFNHNLETVRRLYPAVNRKSSNYYISLKVLTHAHTRGFVTKTGIMAGLGESREELEELFRDLRASGAELLTIGQYLQPTKDNVPVQKYYTPEEFEDLKKLAILYGFTDASAGPFVRSSYNARQMFSKCAEKKNPAKTLE